MAGVSLLRSAGRAGADRNALPGLFHGRVYAGAAGAGVVVMGLLRRRAVELAEGVCNACGRVTCETDRVGRPMHQTCIVSILDTVDRETRDYRRWSR